MSEQTDKTFNTDDAAELLKIGAQITGAAVGGALRYLAAESRSAALASVEGILNTNALRKAGECLVRRFSVGAGFNIVKTERYIERSSNEE